MYREVAGSMLVYRGVHVTATYPVAGIPRNVGYIPCGMYLYMCSCCYLVGSMYVYTIPRIVIAGKRYVSDVMIWCNVQ